MKESTTFTPKSTPSPKKEFTTNKIIKSFSKKNPNDKKGRSTSCLLCQKRKQKCDHRLPSCTTCIKAGVECIQPLKYAVKAPDKDEYTIMLEKKVKFLEKIIDSNNITVESKSKKSSFKFKKFSPFIENSTTQYKNSLVANYNLLDYLKLEPLFNIDEQSSKIMLNMYFSKIQFKYPLLNEDEMYDFHNTYLLEKNQESCSNLIYNFKCAKLFCILAIGSVLYRSTHYKSNIKAEIPSRYFATGLNYLIECGENLTNEDKVKMLNLIVLYLIRTDFDTILLHDIIKDSLQISVLKLNLNKSSTYQNLSFEKKQNFLRIWWCNYLLERSISISVGKPYSIPEYQIDEDLPLILKPFIIQSIKLRRIESKFVEFFKLSSIKQISNLNLLAKLNEFFQLLENWRLKIENNISNFEMETLRLYYYRSIRILIQPFLEILDPNEKLFKECQAAAGQICQLFKKFHENTIYGHSTTSIHSVFNAGVTLIYCLWITRNKDDERRKALGDVSKHTRPQVSKSLFISMNDLRACSICLYVMNERSKFALAFRNIFDQLMFATINNLIERCSEDSSEIIYSNKPGMPPAIVRKYHYIPEYQFSMDKNNNSSPIVSTKYSGINPHNNNNNININNININKLYDEERMIKQNNLQKNIIPKSLSHLLINSPESSSSSSIILPTPQSPITVDSPIPELQLDSNLKFPTNNTTVSFLNMTTNTMINNISNWTEISGGIPILPTDIPNQNFTNLEKDFIDQNYKLNYNLNSVEEFWKYGSSGNLQNINSHINAANLHWYK